MQLMERALGCALIGGILLNFLNVVGRYAANKTITGADEIEIYILIGIAFLGSIAVTWRRQHLRMDVLLNACPPIIQNIIAVVEFGIFACVTAFVAYYSFLYVEKMYVLGAVSDIARIPTWIPHSTVMICFSSMSLLTAIQAIRRPFKRQTIEHVQLHEVH